MLSARTIPCLLLKERGVVKSERFESLRYVGCPVNAARVFCAKGVDELLVLDIEATERGRGPDLALIGEIAGECAMPLTAGGGVRSVRDMEALLRAGADKVCVNTAAVEVPGLIAEAARAFGSQCVVVSIDVRRCASGHQAFIRRGRTPAGEGAVALARRMQEQGAGEVLLTSIDRDGTMQGYDLPLVSAVSPAVTIPVVACGGAGSLAHLEAAAAAGADAVAAGSLFLYYGPRRSVLVNFPDRRALAALHA